MDIKNIGRFVVTIELDRVDGEMRYYDSVLSKDGMEIQIHKGCFGIASAKHWASKLETLAKRLEVLYLTEEAGIDNGTINTWINELISEESEGFVCS